MQLRKMKLDIKEVCQMQMIFKKIIKKLNN